MSRFSKNAINKRIWKLAQFRNNAKAKNLFQIAQTIMPKRGDLQNYTADRDIRIVASNIKPIVVYFLWSDKSHLLTVVPKPKQAPKNQFGRSPSFGWQH